MAVSNAKRISIANYQQEKCDRITADIPKGKRAAYKQIAAELNLSLALLIQHGVEEYAQNHAGENFASMMKNFATKSATESTPEKKLTAKERQLVETFARLPEKTQAKFTGLLENVAGLVDAKDNG